MDFNNICKDIKSLKIQGAENVAIAAVKAYSLNRTKTSIKKLISLRPTEPCLRNALNFSSLNTNNIRLALNHLNKSRKIAALLASKLIKNNSIIYTHCHSSTVNMALIEAKKSGKNFHVYCTETRPFMQGRLTAKEMAKAKIPVKLFVDSAMRTAIKEADLCFIGADAITSDLKIINKIGSGLAADTAKHFGVPVYVLTDSWKFDPATIKGSNVKIEERESKEIWKNHPKSIKISNYVFEEVDSSLIKSIISEIGVLPVKKFVYEVVKKYKWMKGGD